MNSKMREANAEKGIKKLKIRVYMITICVSLVFFPLLTSWITKFNYEKEQQKKYDEMVEKISKEFE